MSIILEEIENVTVRREVVAPRTTINWNPLDNSGSVVFNDIYVERNTPVVEEEGEDP